MEFHTFDTEEDFEMIREAERIALNMLHDIAEKTSAFVENKDSKHYRYNCFNDITATFIVAYSYGTSYITAKRKDYTPDWEEVKKLAHRSLDIAFKAIHEKVESAGEKVLKNENH